MELQVVIRRPDALYEGRSSLPFWRARRRVVFTQVLGVLSFVSFASNAQEASPAASTAGAAFSIIPSLGVIETLTSNVRLDSDDPRSDLITSISPRLRFDSNSGRIKGSVDYTLTGLFYVRESSSNEVQQALRAQGTLEAIDKQAYIDANASISQQSRSAFGRRSPDSALIDPNRTEVFSYQVSPHAVGRLGGLANYEARWSFSSTSSQGSGAAATSQQASLKVFSDTATLARIGWSVDYVHQISDYSNQGSRTSDSLNGTLFYTVNPELRLSARAGRESNDLATVGREQYNTWGFGGTWTPSERTSLDVTRDHRFFGNAYNVRFQHRSQRSVWTFSSGQSVSTTPLTSGSATPLTVFDLLFAQFASIAPDPVQRTALVDAFLRNNGLTRATLISGGFLTTTATVSRNKTISLALLGLRSTVLFSAFRNESRAVDANTPVSGDLSNGNTVYQRGMSMNVSHRLTPLSALSADLSISHSNGSSGNRSTELRSLNVTWTNRLSDRVDLSLSARRALFDSTTDPYNESAVIANLSMRF